MDVHALVRQFVTEFCRVSIDEPYLARLMADESARDSERLEYLYERDIEPTFALVVPSIARLTASGGMTRVPMDVVFFAGIAPVSGLVQEPLARRLGSLEHMQQADCLARAEALAGLVVDDLSATRRR
ncbi:hypothetical protein [Streptomyces sp. NPDC001714]|uniref:hypothetical protein n=1 Tax=Streptomyces sp. NPDC001714 TaxID=3364603 RepID=UPI0036B9BFAB